MVEIGLSNYSKAPKTLKNYLTTTFQFVFNYNREHKHRTYD